MGVNKAFIAGFLIMVIMVVSGWVIPLADPFKLSEDIKILFAVIMHLGGLLFLLAGLFFNNIGVGEGFLTNIHDQGNDSSEHGE